MSLLVWLPLNGDIKNQGLSGVSLNSNSTPVYDNNGKIGKCYSTSTFLYNDDYTELSGGIFSVAYWVKYTSFPQYNAYCISLNGTTSSDYMFMVGVQTASGLLSVNTSSSGASLSLNKWYHVAYTYNGTTGTLYLDGTKIKTWTGFTCNKAATHLTINGRYGSRPIHSGSYLNDVRIYDHCLSAKEVKEISKGLVLHYKLTDNEYGNPNLLLNSQTYNLNQTGTTRLTASQRLDTSLYPLSNTIGKTFTVSYDINMEGNFTAATNAPSYDASGNRSAPYVSVSYNGGSIKYFTSHMSQKGEGRKFFNFTITSSWTSVEYITVNLEINSYPSSGQEWSIRNVKLEEGSKATPYIPNDKENIYEVLGFNSTTEYDCSGYKHNGTKVNIKASSDSPRYDSSEAFLGTTVDKSSNTLTGAAYITAGLPLPTSSALTVSWWGKITKYGRGGIFETTGATSDYVNGTDYSTTAFANWDSTFGIYNGSTRINLYSNMGIPNSSWQLNTITFDGTNVKYYKNGALVSTNALSGTLPAFNGIKIGIGKAGGVYRQIQQYVSDFRIYVTALSAEEVKELYQIPIMVDKVGNAFAFEFIESQKPEFEKTGIVKNNYIYENEADDSDTLKTFHISKTKTFANQIIEV